MNHWLQVVLGLLRLLFVRLLGGCVIACVPTGRTADVPRSYVSGYEEGVKTVANVLQDMGLSVEHGGPETDSSYVLNAVRIKRLAGISEPVPVAKLRIYVSAVGPRTTCVSVDQEKVARTSMVGNDSVRRDYGEQLFVRLEGYLERADESPPCVGGI